MDRQERLDLTQDVYTSWVAKYDDLPGFDPENPTPEQEADYYAAAKEAGLPIGGDEWSKYVNGLSEDELKELLASDAYTVTSIPGL
jgi:hypothetical protein